MTITVDISDHVATVTLNHPPVNALTTALYGEVADIFSSLGEEPDVRCAHRNVTGFHHSIELSYSKVAIGIKDMLRSWSASS